MGRGLPRVIPSNINKEGPSIWPFFISSKIPLLIESTHALMLFCLYSSKYKQSRSNGSGLEKK